MTGIWFDPGLLGQVAEAVAQPLLGTRRVTLVGGSGDVGVAKIPSEILDLVTRLPGAVGALAKGSQVRPADLGGTLGVPGEVWGCSDGFWGTFGGFQGSQVCLGSPRRILGLGGDLGVPGEIWDGFWCNLGGGPRWGLG